MTAENKSVHSAIGKVAMAAAMCACAHPREAAVGKAHMVFIHAIDECREDGEMPRTERCGGKGGFAVWRHCHR